MRMCVCVGKRIGFMFKMAEKLQEMISSDWRYFNIQEFSNNHCYCVPVTRWLDINFFFWFRFKACKYLNLWFLFLLWCCDLHSLRGTSQFRIPFVFPFILNSVVRRAKQVLSEGFVEVENGWKVMLLVGRSDGLRQVRFRSRQFVSCSRA